MAAKSELEDRNSSESARHLFLRALRFHPNNKKVYQEVKDAKKLTEKPYFSQRQECVRWRVKRSDILFKFLHQLCASTSAWNCFTVRNWGSRRRSWRKPRWTWWVRHKPNKKKKKHGKSQNVDPQTENRSVSVQHLNTRHALHAFQGEYEFSPEILSGKLAEVIYRDATGKINGRFFFFPNYVQKLISVALNLKPTDVWQLQNNLLPANKACLD